MAIYGQLGVKGLILLFGGSTGYNRYLIGVCSYQSRKHFSDRQSCIRYAMHLLTTLKGNYKLASFLFFFEKAHLARLLMIGLLVNQSRSSLPSM